MSSLTERHRIELREPPARAAGFAPGQPGYAQYALGRAARLDAMALAGNGEGLGAALLLMRSAVLLFAEAARSRALGDGADPASRIDVAGAGGAPSIVDARAREEFAGADTLLDRASGESYAACLDQEERRAAFAMLSGLARRVGEPLERAADELRRVQVARSLTRLLAIGAALLGMTWIGWKLLGRENLALHDAVTVSSAERRVRAHPRGLVDGDRKSMAFHTKKGRNEFAIIDLGEVETISAVEIYNRLDCCQKRAVPLRLDVSTDGQEYTTVARRTKTFALWKVPLPPTRARYVRLVNEGHDYFHLTEVEVY